MIAWFQLLELEYVACSEESPGDRMDINDVVMELNVIKEMLGYKNLRRNISAWW